jgi:hypothetical protein
LQPPKVANQQRHLSFLSENHTFLATQNIVDQARGARGFFSLDFYFEKGVNWHWSHRNTNPAFLIQSIKYEPIHFLLTTTWMLLGGLIQFLVILRNIRIQPYIPLIWKAAIISSSFFLMGPLFIYFFCIFTILTSNASIPEKKNIILLVGSINKHMDSRFGVSQFLGACKVPLAFIKSYRVIQLNCTLIKCNNI